MIFGPAGLGKNCGKVTVAGRQWGSEAVMSGRITCLRLGVRNGFGYIYDKSDRAVCPMAGRQLQTLNLDFEQGRDMSIEQFIENEVKTNDVVLFMKGTPQFPQCGFSGQVVQILDHVGVGYKGLNVLESADLRDGIKTYSNWPTIPQLYVKGEFVGGCDIVREMFQAGELQSHLQEQGVAIKGAA